MGVFNIAKQIVGTAIEVVIGDAAKQLIPPKVFEITNAGNRQSKRHPEKHMQERKAETWEIKLYEIVVLLVQIINSIFSLIKLIRAFVPNKLWKSPYQ